MSIIDSIEGRQPGTYLQLHGGDLGGQYADTAGWDEGTEQSATVDGRTLRYVRRGPIGIFAGEGIG